MLLCLNDLQSAFSEEPWNVQDSSDLPDSPQGTDNREEGLHLN